MGRDGATIYALASGKPPAAIAVVRLSGPRTRAALERVAGGVPEARRASLRRLRNAAGDILDHGFVLWLPGPGSFTGEDSAELHLHGGRAVVSAVLAALGEMPGFRPAEPGEFTRRALHNGRMDLTAVEGLADLIAAETEAQRRQALRQADGALCGAAERWRTELIAIRALVEAELDFSDEADVPHDVAAAAWKRARRLGREIAAVLARAGAGERLRDGLDVVLMGPPNAGKSSLLNALARRDVAIVTPEPGTTRDVLEARLDCGGYPVTLVDTAGLRAAAGPVEREGIARAERRGRAADLVLWLEDASDAAPAPPPDLPGEVWPVATKIDLVPPERGNPFHVKQAVSVVSGEGLAELEAALGDFAEKHFGGEEWALVTRARQRHEVAACAAHLGRAASSADLPAELRAEELRAASDALGRLTGRIGVEDVLGAIFQEFCIGK